MNVSAPQAKRRLSQLGEILRIVELRTDAKRIELDGHIEAQKACELAVQAQQRLCDKAGRAVDVCARSIAAAKAVKVSPGSLPGFMVAHKQLQKLANAERKKLALTHENLSSAQALVAQTQTELQRLRTRSQQLEKLSKGLAKYIATRHSLLEDTLQDEDFASYLGAKAYAKRAGFSLAA